MIFKKFLSTGLLILGLATEPKIYESGVVNSDKRRTAWLWYS